MKNQTIDVFTPTKPARLAFVERESVNDKLVNALRTPGRQIVVYGHSGTGKTTLLVNKLQQLYEFHITTRCMQGLCFEQLILDAFDQLEPYYTSQINKSSNNEINANIAAQYLGLKGELRYKSNYSQTAQIDRILPPQLTPQSLGKFLGNAKACWVLEDFHKIADSEKTQLSQLMKIFMDLSDEFPSLKIIAIGAVDTARQVVEYDYEMRNRVAEIHVSPMNEGEIFEIIEKGEKALNIKFDPKIKRLISQYSSGLASVCHHLGLNMCIASDINETVNGDPYKFDSVDWKKAATMYIEDASDSVRAAFDSALKQRRKTIYPNAQLILSALSRRNDLGAARNDILIEIRKKEANYPETNLKYMLPKLCTSEYGAIIKFDSNSGRFSFSHPIYRAYAIAHFYNGEPMKGKTISIQSDALTQALLKFLNAIDQKK